MSTPNLEDSILECEYFVGNMGIRDTFYPIQTIDAMLNKEQIIGLTEQNCVSKMDWGDREGTLSMYEAQSATNTNDLRISPYYLDGTDVTVALVDSGYWTGHGDLNDGQLVGFKDIYGSGTYDDFSSPIVGIDDNGHGTSMAGIIVGSGDGDPYLVGIAPDAEIVAVRIAGSSTSVVYSDAISAFNWIYGNYGDLFIDVVSCSFGFPPTRHDYYGNVTDNDDLLARLADILVSEGLVVVASIGNYRIGLKEPMSPSSGKNVITVGAAYDSYEGGWELYEKNYIGPVDYTDIVGDLDWYKPDVLAPGVNIECPDRDGGATGYQEVTGTSPATAFVAGLVCQLLDYDSDLSHDSDNDGNPDVKQLIMGSAVDLPDDNTTGIDKYWGAGRVDGIKAIEFLNDVSTSKVTAPDIPSIGYIRLNEPMWRLDSYSMGDWYKIVLDVDSTIIVDVDCDDNLMVEIILYSGSTKMAEDESTDRGEDCYLSYDGYESSTYYLLVILTGTYGTMGYPADYYDIEITIES
ncbi:MAG: S8 family serine peptidase [Candidatus Thorarchaeota archaeon]